MLKIAMIGAGSVRFTRRLTRDLMCVPELRDTQFAYTDINADNLEMATNLARRDFEANNCPVAVTATMDRREAVTDADYVINMVRVGGIECVETDTEIPLKYGVDQCIADTLCAGGIMYGQRQIPAVLEFCKDIREVAKPGCLFLSYSNPNAMVTWAANHHGGVPTIGLCHGVHHTANRLAGWLGVPVEEMDATAAGINHQTWFLSLKHKGEELRERLLEAVERDAEAMAEEKVRIDLLRRTGYWSTESNGHLSEYLPWYRKRPDDLANWIGFKTIYSGQTAGELKNCRTWLNWKSQYDEWLKEPIPPFDDERRSIEQASRIIEGLELGRTFRGSLNVVNNGTIANLPDDCVVEVPGYCDRNGVSIPRVGDLPLVCAAICNASVSVQRLAVEAAVAGDVALLKQAMMMDPLVGAVCNPPEIWRMTDEMLVAQAEWLPQYKNAIAEAKKNLEGKKPQGARPTKGIRGKPEAKDTVM